MRARQVVVITGASSGIGRATALRFAKEGADLVLASRREAALEDLAVECRALGGQAAVCATEVTDEQQVDALADRAVARFGRIDVWINDAAIAVFAPLVDAPIDEVRRVLDVNIMGYVHGARAALRVMREQGSGTLVNVSSIVGEVPQPFTAPYGMSKAAVRAMGVSPAALEAQTAAMVQSSHLSLTDPAEDTSGTLFAPAADPGDPTATGGWAGRSRTAGRVLVAGVLAVAGGVLLTRRLSASGA